MAKKKGMKLDKSQIKNYLAAKGERVGLIIAAALMLILLVTGISMGLGTHIAVNELNTTAKNLVNRTGQPTVEPPSGEKTEEEKKAENKGWGNHIAANQYPVGGWFDPGAVKEDKVFNPFALALAGTFDSLDVRKNVIKLDVVRGPVKVNKIDGSGNNMQVWVLDSQDTAVGTKVPPPGGAGGPPAQTHLVNYLEAKRMIVVSGLFPYKEQLEVFQKILRKTSTDQMLAEGLGPKFLGLNVVRCRVVDGQFVDFMPLFFQDPKEEDLTVQKQWKEFFQLAKIDPSAYEGVEKYVQPGLVTPLPELAQGSYPKIDLPKIKIEASKSPGPGIKPPGPGGKPGLPGTGLPGVGAKKTAAKPIQLALSEFAKSEPALADKLKGEINVFDPNGVKEPSKEPGDPGTFPKPPDFPKPPVPPQPPGPDKKDPGKKFPPPGGPKQPGPTQLPDYLLVRFVDVTVEPGNTYKYFIQVRLENPNYKKQSRVAYPGLAEVKELLSDWTETPSRAVDSEFRFYVVDQYLLDKASPKNPTVLHPFTKDTSLLNANGPNRGQMVALQLHNWAESGKGEVKEGNIGAWAVAERVVVKKGQEIGKPNLSVPMPRWDDASDSFLLPEPKKGKDGKAILKSVDWAKIVKVVQFEGSEVNMQPPGPSLPLVVDVKGGQSENWQKIDIADRAAVEVLILSPDGKLVSYNSREDSDPDTPRGKERLEHYSLWKDSIQPHDPKTDTKGPGDKKIGS